MLLTSKYNLKTLWWIGALMCASLTACSADSTVEQIEEHENQTPMQFSQAAVTTPAATRATTSSPLKQGFLVSCWKGIGSAAPQQVMGNYEVKYKFDGWNNQSKWDYVGTKADGYYQDQIQRYWDAAAMPYQFYAITPCPDHADISGFVMSNTEFEMPASVVYTSETCNNGTVTAGAEPYYVSQVQYDMAASYVALPFRHLTSKVRFALYSPYESNDPTALELTNIVIKASRDGGFVTSAKGYNADLTKTSMLEGEFVELTTASGDYVLLTDDGTSEFAKNNEEKKAYWCQCEDGLLQIPQDKLSLKISFALKNDGFKQEYIKENEHVKYDKTTQTLTYTDIPVTVSIDNQTTSSFAWKSNNIYTYKMKITEFYPIRIECTAELTPWNTIEGSIDTNLEY